MDLRHQGLGIPITVDTREGVMPVNHPGCDLVSKDEVDARCIEEKTIHGKWTHVLITEREFSAGQRHGDRFWVYVVELHAYNKYVITRIQNPFARVTHYTMDAGWKVVENPHFKAGSDDYDDLYAN